MALISCPQCGTQVSDKAEKCIHCGWVIKEKPKKLCEDCGNEIPEGETMCPVCGCPAPMEPESETDVNPIVPPDSQNQSVSNISTTVIDKKFKSHIFKRKYIVAAAAILFVISLFVIVQFLFVPLNEDEQLAYDNVVTMKAMMKDPSSFKLLDELFLWKRYDSDGSLSDTYTLIQYSGTNSYGAVVTNEAIFSGSEYVMNYQDKIETPTPQNVEEVSRKFMIQSFFTKLAENGGEPWDGDQVVEINASKIRRKLKLSK